LKLFLATDRLLSNFCCNSGLLSGSKYVVPSNETTSGAFSTFSSLGVEHETNNEIANADNTAFLIKYSKLKMIIALST
jgi:hypothetical protein